MRLFCYLIPLILSFSAHASLLPGAGSSELIERSKVSGVLLNDTVCDISGVAVLEEDADMRLSMLSDGKSMVLREKKQRYYLEISGDSLLWTGYENRLLQMTGDGVAVYVPGISDYSGSGAYGFSGMHSLVYPVSETGTVSSSSSQIKVVSGGDVIHEGILVRTVRSFAMCDSLVETPLIQESARIYIPDSPYAAIELRAFREPEYKPESLSNLQWEEEYISPSLLSQVKEKSNEEEADKDPFTFEVIGQEVKVDIVSPRADCDIEVSLCTLSGIPYLTERCTCGEGETVSLSLNLSPDQQGGSLLVVRIDDEVYKRLINFK